MNVVKLSRGCVRETISFATAAYVKASWAQHRRQAQLHDLPGCLAITLTSYPPRFPTLALTIQSLLAQTVRADHLYLWIAQSDIALLPSAVTRLEDAGLTIRACDDLRSYKKVIPALLDSRGQFLLTVDDDVYYQRHWLKEITDAYRGGRKEVLCGRAHQIRLDVHGGPLPYSQWEGNVAEGRASRLIFPTGVGGVLYEPNIFHADVTRAEVFLRLCPTGDDIWLYWMAALNGARFRKVGRRSRLITWNESQQTSLYNTNQIDNDPQIANMVARYGFPDSRDDHLYHA